MDSSKLVSVIIPTYKRADQLSRAVNSVLNQDYTNIEVIVVDDNNPSSVDRKQTTRVMGQYKDNKKVAYLKHNRNKNGSAARNTGFDYSRGDYIMFLDDDDEFLPTKVSSQVMKLNSLSKDWGACYTSYIRKRNNKIFAYSGEKREGFLLKDVLMRNLFVHAGSNLMIRRSVLHEVNGFDESFTRNQDIELLSRILLKYKLAYADVLGLAVYFDDKNRVLNFEEITRHYLKKMGPIIERLLEKEKEQVYDMISLQLFRYYITTKGKRKKAVNHIFKSRLSLVQIVRYLSYLSCRRITKRVYGFDI